jgi:hypothetical protein
MNLEEKQKLIPNMSMEALAANVVVYKSLGIYKDFAIKCMEELAKRKALGNTFDYEKFIEDELKKIPNFKDTVTPANTSNILSMIKSMGTDPSILNKKV